MGQEEEAVAVAAGVDVDVVAACCGRTVAFVSWLVVESIVQPLLTVAS